MEESPATTRRQVLRIAAGTAATFLLPRALRAGGGLEGVEPCPPEYAREAADRLVHHRRLAFAEAIAAGRLEESAVQVDLDLEKSGACIKHAAYILFHDQRLSGSGSEEQGKAGFSEEGAAVPSFAVRMPTASPRLAMDILTEGLIWRSTALDPGRMTLLFGAARRKGTRQGISYLNLTRSVRGPALEEPLLYPAPGQTDVPMEYIPYNPDVIPLDDAEQSGPGVTAQFLRGTLITEAKMELFDGNRREVDSRVSCPESPFDPPSRSANTWLPQTLVLLPRKALKRKGTYRVRFSATVKAPGEDAKPRKWEREWTFRTLQKARDVSERYVLEVR